MTKNSEFSQPFLLLGSNQGDCKFFLNQAREKIELRLGRIIQESHIYLTEPWGVENQASYYNQALQIETEMDPNSLMFNILKIEEEAGRDRLIANAPRTLDIDILLWGEQIIKENNIIIPHPRLHLRNFALVPLMEIGGESIHPELGKTIEELFDACKDQNEVQIIDDEEDSI